MQDSQDHPMTEHSDGTQRASEQIRNSDAFRAASSDSYMYALLKEKLPRATIDGQTFFLAEGDTLLDDAQLEIYALQRQKVEEAREAAALADEAGLGLARLGTQSRGLIAMTQGGKVVRWKPGLVLTYRVVENSFTDPERYRLLVDCMRQATEDWEAVCGVEFEHLSALDGEPGVDRAGAIFAVREIDAQGQFIASAFFPNDPLDRRRVLIDPSFYSTSFDKVGVLRHELGHVLGFRHEHIHKKAPPVCPHESLWDTKYLTAYDPQSVMHYFCGDVGSRDLKITEIDKIGSQQVYGPPLKGVELIG